MKSSPRGRRPADAVRKDEQIARYLYLLNLLPRTVIDRAHTLAFAELSSAQRREVLESLSPLLPDIERHAASDDPETLAALVRDPESQDALVHAGIAAAVAVPFVLSSPVAGYFSVGVGSVDIDRQPLWVQELADHDANPIDAGTINHRRGANLGHWYA
jgi:hypothetical protein